MVEVFNWNGVDVLFTLNWAVRKDTKECFQHYAINGNMYHFILGISHKTITIELKYW